MLQKADVGGYLSEIGRLSKPDPLLPLMLLLSMATLSESLFIQTPRFNPVTRAVPSF